MSTRPPDKAWRLDGRRALITGGSSGIGLATAHEFAALGAELFLVARGAGRLESARKALQADNPGCRVTTLSADLATDEGLDRVLAQVEGPLQVLVNTTGTNLRKRMTELSQQQYRVVQEVNLDSSF